MFTSGRDGLYIVVVIASVLVLSVPAGADILSSHFGVTLEIDTNTNYWDYKDGHGERTYPMDQDSYTPTLNTDTADHIVDDWFGEWKYDNRTIFGTKPSGGEPYDVEAIYFDDDQENLYIAIVTSFGPNPGYNGVVSGDIALDFGINDEYSDGFSYDFGVNINNEIRRSDPTKNALFNGSAVGTGLYQTANSDWYLGSPQNDVPGSGELTNFDPNFSSFSGTYLGDAIQADYYEYDFGYYEETLWATYVIEATIPRALFAMEILPDDLIGVQWMSGCRNDNGNLNLYGSVNTPEPGTLALTALGLAGLAWVRRRRSSEQS